MRKTYGNTWWGRQWLNALTDIDYANRLPRGRTYANKGLAHDIAVAGNEITAKVRGTQRLPYRVKFTIPKFSVGHQKRIVELIAANPLHLSRLLTRRLPRELMELCRAAGIELFPASWNDLRGACSCPDHAVPCKHMAAVLYLVANEIDQNPFLVFTLRGFELFDALAEHGYTAEAEREIVIPRLSELERPYVDGLNARAWDEDVFQQLDFSRLPALRDQLLTITSARPVFHPRGDFKASLEKAYASIAKALAKNDFPTAVPEDLRLMDRTEELELLLNEERRFLNVTLRDGAGKILHDFTEETDFLAWLERVPPGEATGYSHALRTCRLAYRFARKLAERSAIVPQLLQINDRAYRVRWLPALLNPTVASLYAGVRSILATNVLYYRRGKAVYEPTEAEQSLALASFFLDGFVRQHHGLSKREEESETHQLFFAGQVGVFSGYEAENYPAAIQLWLNKYYLVEKDHVPVIQVDEEDEGTRFAVRVAVRNRRDRTSVPIPLADVLRKRKHATLRLQLLRDLALLADYFPELNALVAARGEEPLYFDATGFVDVMFKVLPTIRLFGIQVLLPKALRKLMRPRLSMAVTASEESGAMSRSGLLDLRQMLDFEWRIALGEDQLAIPEFREMLRRYAGIVKLNDAYVYFDEREIARLLERLDNPPAVHPRELLHVALTETYAGTPVKLDDRVRERIDHLLATEAVAPPRGLQATLRPYQARGYAWLYKNAGLGFGSLIADDMGLGKTLQVISLLLRWREEGALTQKKALVIVPTTLLTNWDKEIRKFAPALRAHVYHGPQRSLKPLAEADVLLTTYGVARNETALLNKQAWRVTIIDEAQHVKNPASAQTKAVKRLRADLRIAMSGTPVENRLSEYWSIFDFTNPGYLGSLKQFKEQYAKPIEQERDHERLAHFRKVTEPFLLRRLKSDRSIIQDLPAKIEQDQFCRLTPAQAALYENVVNTTLRTIEQSEGIERKGLVLKLITALKQICNHPVHFLKQGAVDPADSGKTRLLFELLSQILERGEKTLIFTQYREMGEILAGLLAAAFDLEVPFLHGGVTRAGRDAMVERFQNDRATRVMLLSLQAGGTGLNLTAASNVIHYDLWWNPAVEAQATDRAYRIGQQRNVLVHRFVTEHTFEEKINRLLQTKKELADLTVSTGETWIGDYGDAELRELVALEEKR